MSAAHRVVVPITANVPIFEVAVACEVFGRARQDFPVPWWYELQLCAVQDGPVRTAEGLLFDSPLGLDELTEADTVIIPGCADRQGDPPQALLRALRTAYDRGARIASICTGAFTLAAAGLLDGRTVTTHWMHAAELTRRWPAVRVEPNVLYTDDGQILTSAGSAAGLDLCLHLVSNDHGTKIANTLARRLVIPPHREGGQAQYIEQSLPAGRARMSPRTYARRFRETTGTTPLQWLCAERVRRAQELLESTDDTIERVATLCGFGSAHQLRVHFTRINQVTPHAYQRTFRSRVNA